MKRRVNVRRFGIVNACSALLLGALVFGASSGNAVTVADGRMAGNIEIDTAGGANLFPGGALKNCGNSTPFPTDASGTDIDWVKDCETNNLSPTGIGHWNGFRTTDGTAQDDEDIFLTGGKENDTSTWNPGPGSVGSAKYDFTQGYLANNQENLYFGAHRRGNDGTTAFDLEANKLAPDPDRPLSDYVPNRSEGDVLFTFEMQGSGNDSGSVAINYFLYNAATKVYVLQTALPAGLLATMNGDIDPSRKVTTAALPPWIGTGTLQLREFLEAKIPLSVLGVSPCGGNAFMQIRTRSSSEPGSDLKDTSKIFKYNFNQPTVTVVKSVTEANRVADAVTLTATPDGFPTGSTLTYNWKYRAAGSTGAFISFDTTTGSPLAYSSFAAHDAAPAKTVFTLSALDLDTVAAPAGEEAVGTYSGKVWNVEIELTISGGNGCSATADVITVKKITAVDP